MGNIGARRLTAALVLLPLALGGCATTFYARTGTGSFAGRLDVEWIAPNRFVYRPHPSDPLVYTTADGVKIQPRAMYTDGGSIPRLFWSTPLLGPWDFAPGYIIHDWLFVQHHCKDPGWEAVTFDRSAQLLAEAIKTQMVKGADADATVVWAIYEAVHSPVALRLWDSGECQPPPPTLQVESASSRGAVVIKQISFGR